MTLRRQLVVVFAVFAAVLVTATTVPLGFASARANMSSFVDDRVSQALRIAELVSRNPEAFDDRLHADADDAWLIDGSGRAPTRRAAFPDGPPSSPEVAAARRETPTHRLGPSPLGRRLFVAVPVPKRTWVLWISSSLAPVQTLNRETWLVSLAIGALILFGAALAGAALARRITRRLSAVAEGAKRFGQGRWDESIPVEGQDEIALLAGQLNQMSAEIGRLIRREKDFVVAASHQLRTPLAAIMIRIDEIRALQVLTNDQARQDLDEMSAEVGRLTALTRRLLDLSAAEAQPESRPVPATAAVRDAIGRVAPLAEIRGVGLRFTGDAPDEHVAAPPGAFEEVLFNVLDNAVKYSPANADVDVSISDGSERVVVEIGDRGPGVPEADRARVFAPFFRGRRAEPGHGLGLAIGARLCAQSSATLRLDPRPGGGTIARIEWPVWRKRTASES